VQFWFALLGIGFLGITLALESFWDEVPPFVSGVLAGFVWLVGEAATFIGLDLEAVFGPVDPRNLFAMTYFITLGFGLLTLLSFYILYKVAGLNPLFGTRGAGGKVGAFFITLLGYAVPFLNLFPFFLVWCFAVARHPK